MNRKDPVPPRAGKQPREDFGGFLRRCASERRRLAYLNGLIPLLRQKLCELRRESPYEAIRITAGWSGPAGRAVPGDPTAAVAVRAADSALRAELCRTERKLRELTAERELLSRRQDRAACCLNALREDERFVVEARVMQDLPWAQVEEAFEARFGVRYHRDTLRRRLSSAVRTLNEAAEGL